jgi:hypothetical protein
VAISGVTDRGSSQLAASSTTQTISPSSAIVVDRIAWVSVAADNISTSDGDTTDHSISDTDSHTWSKVFEHTNTEAGAGADGVTVSLWLTKVTSEIGTGDTVTCTYGSAVTDGVMFIGEFQVGAGLSFVVGSVDHDLQEGAGSATLSGMTSREYLLFGTLGREGETASVTEDGDYTDLQNERSTGLGGASTNIAHHLGYRIATLTGDTYAPTETEGLTAITSLSAVYETPTGLPLLVQTNRTTRLTSTTTSHSRTV